MTVDLMYDYHGERYFSTKACSQGEAVVSSNDCAVENLEVEFCLFLFSLLLLIFDVKKIPGYSYR